MKNLIKKMFNIKILIFILFYVVAGGIIIYGMNKYADQKISAAVSNAIDTQANYYYGRMFKSINRCKYVCTFTIRSSSLMEGKNPDAIETICLATCMNELAKTPNQMHFVEKYIR